VPKKEQSSLRLPAGRHGLPREFIAQNQRERIITALVDTVAERGYNATTVAHITKAASVSRRTFYEHFADKEECFMATFERGVTLLQRAVTMAYTQPGRWPMRMRRGLEVLLHLLAAEPAFANLAIVEMLAAGPRGRESSRQLLRDFLRFFEDAPTKGKQVPLVAIEAVVAGVFGVLFDYVSNKRTAELPGILPEITYFVLTPFIGPRAAAAAAQLPK